MYRISKNRLVAVSISSTDFLAVLNFGLLILISITLKKFVFRFCQRYYKCNCEVSFRKICADVSVLSLYMLSDQVVLAHNMRNYSYYLFKVLDGRKLQISFIKYQFHIFKKLCEMVSLNSWRFVKIKLCKSAFLDRK